MADALTYPPLPTPYQRAEAGYYDSEWKRVPATPERFTAEQMRAYVDADRAARAPSPPVAAPPATPVWDGKLPEALQRKLNALRLECAPAIVSDVEHEVRSVFEGMHTSLATVKRMYAAARDRLEAAEPQVDPFAQPQPQPQPARPLTDGSDGVPLP